MEPGTPSLQSSRLLDQVRERIRYAHYSLQTEKSYHYWICFFTLWSATQPGGMRHPREMGVADVETFLSMLANERKVSASTHKQALSAPLFLYREVVGIDLPWLTTSAGRSDLSALYNLTGIPRSRIRAFACPTVYSP